MLDLAKKILWDYKLSDEEIIRIYSGDLEIGGMNEVKLKARLLNSYNWYTLIKELGFNEARQLLKPEIIQYLYPRSLQKSICIQPDYYESKLYPLQDNVLRLAEKVGTSFYLTGGTALGRTEPKEIADILFIEKSFLLNGLQLLKMQKRRILV